LIVAFATVELFILATEWFVDQWSFAHRTEETFFVPMSIFVREVLGFGTDFASTLFAGMGKAIFIASDTIRLFIF
jgi:hypothetical protein